MLGQVQKRMDKHLWNFCRSHKGKLKDETQLLDRKQVQTTPQTDMLQKYYGLTIQQNPIKNTNLSEEVNEASSNIKKTVTAALHHYVKHKEYVKQQEL